LSIDDSVAGTCRFIISDHFISIIESAYKPDFRTIFELENKEYSTSPDSPIEREEWLKKYWFVCEMIIPLKNKVDRVLIMREGIIKGVCRLLGIEAVPETRRYKCVILVRTDKSIKQRKRSKESRATTLKEVVGILRDKLEDMKASRPFIDETGISESEEIEMTVNSGSIEDMMYQLEKCGFTLIESERDIEVVIIREKQ